MDSLKKELEEELKLSTEDLRSHAWYHGLLSREVHIHQCCSFSEYFDMIQACLGRLLFRGNKLYHFNLSPEVTR